MCPPEPHPDQVDPLAEENAGRRLIGQPPLRRQHPDQPPRGGAPHA